MQTALGVVVIRLGGVVLRYGVQQAGSPLVRAATVLFAAAEHAAVLLLALAAALLVWRALPSLRRVTLPLACLGFAILLVGGEADLIVSHITGEPLLPTTFRAYRGPGLFTSNEFLQPLEAHAAVIAPALSLMALLAVLVGVRLRRFARGPGYGEALPGRPLRRVLLVAVLLGAAPHVALPVVSPRSFLPPPPPVEIAFAREYLGLDGAQLVGSEHAAIADLRGFLGLPPGMAWLDDRHPLVYGPTQPAPPPRGPLPDVIVVVVESLRAGEVGWVTGARQGSPTPRLDALADRSVTFPRYLSNGFPSAPSLHALHTSTWPHHRKEVMTDFTRCRFDSLPERLASLGYDTLFVTYNAAFDHQDLWLSRWYREDVELRALGRPSTDRAILDEALAHVRRHDEERGDRPLFLLVPTVSTHYPFVRTADSDEPEPPDGQPLASSYRAALRYADARLGAFVDALERRARRDDTVLVVVGDHAFRTDLSRTSGLPDDEVEWVSAIVHGPERLVGPPRRLERPASHVDLMPTLMALIGDRRPTATVGSDLLGPPRAGHATAVSVRPGGVRLEEERRTILVDRRSPNAGTDGATLYARVQAFSYLIEQDRLWDPALLDANEAHRVAHADPGEQRYRP